MDDYVTKPVRGAALDAAIDWDGAPVAESVLDGKIVDELRDEFVSAGAQEQLVALIDSFLGNASEGIEALRAAAAAGDLERVRSAAHRLKGTAANLGAARLREVAAAIEGEPGSADVDGLAAALDATRPALRAAVA
jgi:two-component system sensor histidine kinase/response regulator